MENRQRAVARIGGGGGAARCREREEAKEKYREMGSGGGFSAYYHSVVVPIYSGGIVGPAPDESKFQAVVARPDRLEILILGRHRLAIRNPVACMAHTHEAFSNSSNCIPRNPQLLVLAGGGQADLTKVVKPL